MRELISQEEVDALFEGVGGDSHQPPGPPAAGGGSANWTADGEVRPYVVASEDHIARGPMPALDIVNARFARNLGGGLFNLMGRRPAISAGQVSVQKFSTFIRQFAATTHCNIVAIRPLRGSGLIVCESSLIFAVIDALYGGTGTLQPRIHVSDFSATEQRSIKRLETVITEAYDKAWHGICSLEFVHLRTEVQPQLVNIATPGERVITTSFQLEIGEITGAIHFCFPYATFAPIRDVLTSTTGADFIEVDRRWANVLTREIQAVEVTLVAQLALQGATVAQVLSMKTGDFIRLDAKSQIQATVEGVPVFACRFGTHNAKHAIRIDENLRRDDPNAMGDRHGK